MRNLLKGMFVKTIRGNDRLIQSQVRRNPAKIKDSPKAKYVETPGE